MADKRKTQRLGDHLRGKPPANPFPKGNQLSKGHLARKPSAEIRRRVNRFYLLNGGKMFDEFLLAMHKQACEGSKQALDFIKPFLYGIDPTSIALAHATLRRQRREDEDSGGVSPPILGGFDPLIEETPEPEPEPEIEQSPEEAESIYPHESEEGQSEESADDNESE